MLLDFQRSFKPFQGQEKFVESHLALRFLLVEPPMCRQVLRVLFKNYPKPLCLFNRLLTGRYPIRKP